MRKLMFTIMLFCGLSVVYNGSAQNCKIDIHLKNCTDSVAYLAYYFNGKIYAKDTTKLVNGRGLFNENKPLDEGVYVLCLPNKQFVDVLIGKEQRFAIEATVNKQIENVKISGCKESKDFQHFQNFMANQKQEFKRLQNLYQAEKSEKKKKQYQKKINRLEDDIRERIYQLDKKYPNTMLSDFLKATLAVHIPDFDEVPLDTPDREKVIQEKKYYYNRKHYFDEINFANKRLLRTPILKSKLQFYFEKMLPQISDTITKEAVNIIEQSKSDTLCFQYYTQFSLNYAIQSKIMGVDASFVDLAKKYYLSGQATWVDSTSLIKIKDRVIKLQSNLLGKTAPELKLENINGEYVRLSEVEAPYTVVYFWEPNCGHCKTVTPLLKKQIIDKFKDKGVKIFAVYTQTNRKLWGEAIAKYKIFDMINCYDPSFFSNFRVLYDVYSTPTIYLLDKDKKIIAKKIDVATLKDILNRELGLEKTK